MELVSPGLGLIFWMTLSFAMVLLILRKYAWNPILTSIRMRERVIAKSLINARRIEEDLAQIQAISERRTEDTEKQCKAMLHAAEEEAEHIIHAAKSQALIEATKIMAQSAQVVESQKKAAMLEVRGQIAKLSLDMAEKVLQEEFSDPERNKVFVKQLLNELVPN